MQIPPLILYDDKEALLAILKAFACKEEALSAFAASEAKKLHALISFLERIPDQTNYLSTDASLVKDSVMSGYQAADTLHNTLQSSLHWFLKYKGLDMFHDLMPPAPGLCCLISARGKGAITNASDAYCNGQAHLLELRLDMQRGLIRECRLHYQAEHETAGRYEILSPLRDPCLYFQGTPGKCPTKLKPNIAVITGYITMKNDNFIVITLWDCGGRHRQDKFRIAAYAAENPVFVHDSGIVTSR